MALNTAHRLQVAQHSTTHRMPHNRTAWCEPSQHIPVECISGPVWDPPFSTPCGLPMQPSLGGVRTADPLDSRQSLVYKGVERLRGYSVYRSWNVKILSEWSALQVARYKEAEAVVCHLMACTAAACCISGGAVHTCRQSERVRRHLACIMTKLSADASASCNAQQDLPGRTPHRQ